MGGGRKIAILLMALALVAVLVAGCGSSDSSSSSGTTAAADSTSSDSGSSSSSDSSGSEEESSDGSSGESGADNEFVKPGGKSKNPIALFGEEGDDAEREAASAVLEENLEARASGDWEGQCSSLAASVVKTVEEEAGLKGGNACAKALKASAEPVSRTKEARANTMTEPVAVLRVEGNKAYALFHGAKGVDYAMPMENAGGTWKVASLVTEELP
jgi:flagellum-specific peptidoglycan hydrolase FlgJ